MVVLPWLLNVLICSILFFNTHYQEIYTVEKIMLVVVFIIAGFTSTSVFTSDQQFRQMEEKKIFDKIRTKMIVGCYTQGKKLQSQVTSLEQLETLFPQRVCACSVSPVTGFQSNDL